MQKGYFPDQSTAQNATGIRQHKVLGLEQRATVVKINPKEA
jgi:hypothetical protein